MKHKITLPRRDVLKLGAMGVFGTMIAASTLPGKVGAQTPSIENIKSNLKAIRFGDFNPNYAAQWSVRLAQALGYFQEHGIEEFDITLSEEYMPGLIGGSLDITHGDTSVFVGAGVASGLPIKIISIYRHSEWWIMGVAPGINTAEDLKGKNITGGGLAGRNTWVQKQLVAKLGLQESDVNFVPSSGGSDGRLGALLAGTVQGASVFPRHRKALEEAGGKFLIEELAIAPQEAFGAMGGWLEANEDAAYAFTLADLKARQWLFKPENKQKAYQAMRDLGYEIPASFEDLYQVELDQISPDGGFESAEAMDRFMAEIAITGEVPENVDWRKYVDFKYTWAAQEALGLPKRPASI
ncbi:ABC transporter substrate-binding protein [Pseudoxanthobacter sp. M-2]|uniref:ABC transporter substrate-binding protein n=1 Tax=Pseudoxanthobacter sp. M-2 TaxID=3078754 RepID=UPI0038FC7FC2